MILHTPKPIYYFTIAFTTQLILAMAAGIVLLPIGLLAWLPLSMMGFLLLYNTLVATLIAVILTSRSQENKPAVIKGDGLVIGHLVGLVLGGMLGMRFGGVAGALGGAAVLYFVMGWLGARTSMAVSAYIDRRTAGGSRFDQRSAALLRRPNTSSLLVYGLLIPTLLMAAALAVKNSGLPVAQYPEILPPARIALIALSLASIATPWLHDRSRLAGKSMALPLTAGRTLLFGLTLAPAVYGFLLFIGFGLSLAELSLFAVTASVAATTWGMAKR